MEKMKKYRVHRDGTPEEGPFTLEQLTYMWETGQVTSVDTAAEEGTEEWFNVAYLIAPAALEPIKARRRQQRPHATAAAMFAMLGLVSLLFFWPAGVLLIVVSCLIDRTTWNCGQCSSKVEETTKVCSKCGAHLRFEWHPEKVPVPVSVSVQV